MVYRIHIPEQVLTAIREHVNAAVNKCVRNFPSVYEKEDGVTGYLFGVLQTDGLQEVLVTDDQLNGIWQWEINFGTFGSGGGGSSESLIGADGIIELSMTQNRETVKKALLFQSKVNWTTRDQTLYEQCTKLMTWLGAAAVIDYAQTGFTAYDVEAVFEANGHKPEKNWSLQSMINDEFLVCNIGDSDLEYDKINKRLIWRDINRDTVYTQFNLSRSLDINIYAPQRSRFPDVNDCKEIPASQVAMHPLNSEILNPHIYYVNDLKELRKIKGKLNKRLHSDKLLGLPESQVIYYSDLLKVFNEQITEREKVLKQRKWDEEQLRRRKDDEPPQI